MLWAGRAEMERRSVPGQAPRRRARSAARRRRPRSAPDGPRYGGAQTAPSGRPSTAGRPSSRPGSPRLARRQHPGWEACRRGTSRAPWAAAATAVRAGRGAGAPGAWGAKNERPGGGARGAAPKSGVLLGNMMRIVFVFGVQTRVTSAGKTSSARRTVITRTKPGHSPAISGIETHCGCRVSKYLLRRVTASRPGWAEPL